MESGEQGHYIGLDDDVLWRRHNAGGCTHSWEVYMVPHCSVCIWVPLSPLLALLLLRRRLHVTTVYAQFTALILWSTAPFYSAYCVPIVVLHKLLRKGHKHNKRQKKNRLAKRLMLAKKQMKIEIMY